MKSEDALVEAWNETLSRKGNTPAIFNTRGEVLRTFEQIEDRARELEKSLAKFGSGEVVAIQTGNHVDWASWLISCLRRKLVVLPLERAIGPQEYKRALGICHVAGVVTGDDPVVAAGVSDGSSKRSAAGTAAATANNWGDHPPSLLKLTSGTTAEPRAIRFRSGQLLADCDHICETMGITDADRNFAVIPVSHSYGFSNLITPLIARGVPMVLSSDPIPRAILDDLERSGATVFPGMPVFYQALCELEKIPDLNSLRLCISAGAPLSLDVARKFREKFQRPVHSFYGSSECGGICYDRQGTACEEGFVGGPLRGVELELVDPEGGASRVRVRSDAVGDGYFPEPNEDKLGNGFFVPDDLLRKSDDGFCIVGRASDLINVAGKKINPAEVETELLRCRGVKQAVVFGRESPARHEEVAACVVATSEVTEAQLLKACRERLSSWQVPRRIFLLSEIPVNERGKISRRDLALSFPSQKP